MDRFLAELGVEAWNNFAATVEELGVLERKHWNRPQFDVLGGEENYRRMGEFRFDGENKTYRAFGYFGPVGKRMYFTFLLGFAKKREMKHEMDLAAKRRDFADRNQELLYEFTFKEGPEAEDETQGL